MQDSLTLISHSPHKILHSKVVALEYPQRSTGHRIKLLKQSFAAVVIRLIS